jgi:hypothetical protein
MFLISPICTSWCLRPQRVYWYVWYKKFQVLMPKPRNLVGLFFILIFLIIVPSVQARSGCCSYHGGVGNCQCNDGTPLSSTCAPYYPECSSGNVAAPVISTPVVTQPTSVPTIKPVIISTTKPVAKVTIKPTLKPTIKPKVTSSPSPTPTSNPSFSPSPTPISTIQPTTSVQSQPKKSSGFWGWLFSLFGH